MRFTRGERGVIGKQNSNIVIMNLIGVYSSMQFIYPNQAHIVHKVLGITYFKKFTAVIFHWDLMVT